MAERVDLSAWPDGARQVVARMIHATADESFASSTRIGADAVEGAVAALRRGATVVCDTRMVMAGMPRRGDASLLSWTACPAHPRAAPAAAAGIEMAARGTP